MTAYYSPYTENPEPPMPPTPPRRKRHIVGLSVTAAAALAVGATVGSLAIHNSGTNGTATATSTTALTTPQIAAHVDPGLVDVISTLGYENGTAYGTGIVLTSNGEILTNNHVVNGATSVKVRDVGNDKTYTARVVGYDEKNDVAVIQLQGASGLTVASTGNSSAASVGTKVVALGNAGGQDGTPVVAAGAITALNQSITASDESSGTSEQLTGLLETDANIQAGDSGGALVDQYGQVIGMNTAASSGYTFGNGNGNGQSNGSTSQTQGYAIPINEALSIARQIESGQSSSTVHIGATAFLGVGLATSGSSSGNGFGSGYGYGGGQQTTSGVAIENVEPGTPAANAGLAAGDTLTAVAGQSVTAESQVTSILEKYHPGDKITISWTDDAGTSHTATVTLATGPTA